MKSTSCIVLLLALVTPPVHAKLFRNSYVSFELPNKWDCRLEGTEWVCRSEISEQAKESVIILTAKEVGPADTLAAYEGHLKAPKGLMSKAGQVANSEVVQVRTRMINDHNWIDGMHLASEIPNYYTRYLATTKERIAIVVTFSAHKVHYTKYSNDFFNAILTLKVVADSKLLNSPVGQGIKGPGAELLGPGPMAGIPQDLLDASELPEEGSGSGLGDTEKMALAAILLAAVIAIILIRRRKQNKRRG